MDLLHCPSASLLVPVLRPEVSQSSTARGQPSRPEAKGLNLFKSAAGCGKAGHTPETGASFGQESHGASAPPDARSHDLAAAGGYEKSGPAHSSRSAAAHPGASASAAGADPAGNSSTPATTPAVAAERA